LFDGTRISFNTGSTKFRALLARIVLAIVLCAACMEASYAKSSGGKKDTDDAPVCDIPDAGITSSKKSKDDSGDHRYLLGGVCVDLSASMQATGQAASASLPQFGRLTVPGSQRSLTLNPDAGFKTAIPTALGPLVTSVEVDWTYDSLKGPDQTVNPDEANTSYLGFTVGYASSLMNFWDGSNFQLNATAPNRSSYLAGYQRNLTEELSLAAAVEAGPPASRGADAWRLPQTPPYYTARLRYDKDDWTLHLSGAFHAVEVRGAPLLTGPTELQNGWVASGGLTIPFDFVAKDDAASAQVTYAVRSAIFLGTQSDVSYLAAVLPSTGATRGWSAVASYLHNWNDGWSSNFYLSRLDLSLDLLIAHPSLGTRRIGGNIAYQIDDHWQVGFELDYVDARIDSDGTFGLIKGQNLTAQMGYLWVLWEF
jgi:hypothetical protein